MRTSAGLGSVGSAELVEHPSAGSAQSLLVLLATSVSVLVSKIAIETLLAGIERESMPTIVIFNEMDSNGTVLTYIPRAILTVGRW